MRGGCSNLAISSLTSAPTQLECPSQDKQAGSGLTAFDITNELHEWIFECGAEEQNRGTTILPSSVPNTDFLMRCVVSQFQMKP